MEEINKKSVKKSLLVGRVINSLTLKEKNSVINLEYRPKIDNAIRKYSEISSKAKYEKVLEKCNVEGLREEDFYMAFYTNDNEKINHKLLAYIEEQEWFEYFVKALVGFGNTLGEDNEEDDSKYSMPYSICFLALQAKKDLDEHVSTLKEINVMSVVISKMIEQLVNNTLQVFSKTVIYEYHLSKSKYSDKRNSNKLNQYIKDNFLNVQDIINFYLKYPVLIRRLSQKIIYMVDYYKELLNNLDNSYVNMKKERMVFDNCITDVSCDMGDTHEKGKFVVKIYFNNNSIIYKPRNLYITKQYYSFIEWLNRNYDLYKLPIVKTIWKGTYTIEECVTYESCKTEREIKRFYSRIGYYIAILYLFNGNDIHFENIIAHKEYPYIIDLETLFAHNSEQLIYNNMAIENIARKIHQSVKGSCLLPSYMFRNQKDKGVDISGLGGKKAELPGKRLVLSNMNSDDIRFEMQKGYIENNENIPMLNTDRVEYGKYVEYILSGFLSFMNIIKNNKNKFIKQLDKFGKVRTRQVLRATNNYGYMLQFASHPNYTQNMIFLERMFETVWNHPYSNKTIASYEVEELLEDDIPVFYCLPSEKGVFNGRGKVIKNLYANSSVYGVKEKINALNNKEIKLQKLLIFDSLGYIQNEVDEEMRKIIDQFNFTTSKNNCLSKLKLQNSLNNIVKILENNMICGADDISWLGVVDDSFSGKMITYLSSNLYDGLSGIMLFLSLAYELEQDDKCEKMAQKVLASLINIQGLESKKGNINAMFGICSVIYPLYLFIENKLDSNAITLYDSVISWTNSLLDDIDDNGFSVSGMASITILSCWLFENTGDYKYYKLGKKVIEIINEYGIYYLLDKAKDYEMDELIYAFQMSYKYLNDDKILDFKKQLEKKYRKKIYGANYEVSNTISKECLDGAKLSPLSCIYKLKLYNLNKDSFLLAEVKTCIDRINSEFELDIENKLLRIDLLQEYIRMFPKDIVTVKSCDRELAEIINMYGLDTINIVEKYDSVLCGLGLNSPICGLGYRLLKYKHPEIIDILNFI